MGQKKVHYSDEYRAREAFAVFIKKERPSRSVTKAELKLSLRLRSVHHDFLKLCLEHDGRSPQGAPSSFKKGVYLVLKAIGMTRVEREMKLSRVTLYRMFTRTGNPSLSHLMRVLKYLDLRLWVVDTAFVERGPVMRRLKNEFAQMQTKAPEDVGIVLKKDYRKGHKHWSYVEDGQHDDDEGY